MMPGPGGAVMGGPSVPLDEGWSLIMESGFKPLVATLDGAAAGAQTSAETWISVHTTVYQMCIQKAPGPFSRELYERVGEALDKYLGTVTLPALRELYAEFMLTELVRRWENHKNMVKWIQRIFKYLDRFYVRRLEIANLETVGYTVFLNRVFQTVKNDVRSAVLDIVQRERDGDVVDQSLVKKVVDLFVEMGLSNTEVYSDELERPLLEATAAFYQRQSAQWVEDDSFPAFMLKAEACLAAEQARAAAYLVPRTKERLLRTVEHEVLVVHQQRMLDKDSSGLVTLLVNDAREDLSRLFRLYARVADALQPIATTLKRHVHAEGMELVREQKARVEAASKTSSAAASAAADKPDFIQALLALHDRYTDLVSSCFGEHPTFTRALKEAFEVFVNQQVGKSSTAELFAGYCDELLRVKGAGARMSEEDVEEQLDKLVQLFAYLSDKDVFQEFSRKQLAKRLLMDRSHSDDAESFLITKLKERCGAHFTSKLEGMITDMTLSKDVQEAFQVWFAEKATNMEDVSTPAAGAAGAAEGGAVDATPAPATGASAAAATPGPSAAPATGADTPMSVAPVSSSGVRTNGLDFAVRVLTTGHWPTYAQDKITLPPELYQSEKVFREYYNTRTAQRVLRFVHALGKVWLTTTYYANGRWGGKVELACSTHQACVMMLFNDAESLTYGKICETLGLDPSADVSKGTMLSLSTISAASGGKARAQQSQSVLLRAPAGGAGVPAGSGSSTHVGVNDVFCVNVKFHSQRPKLKLKPLHAKITDAEKEAAQSTVHEDRRHAVEAAIVRVMKQHKRMPHNQLVVQVSELLMPVFKPDPPLIRSRIDELITREYIKRDADAHTYEYLA